MKQMTGYQAYNHIREIFILLEAHNHQALAAFGLTTIQYDTLLHLTREDGWRMSDLCEKVLCDNSKMTRIIDYLEENGWAERRKNPEDRRSLWVYLTATGEAMRERAKQVHTAVLEEHLAIFGEEEHEEFVVMLNKFRAHLTNINHVQN